MRHYGCVRILILIASLGCLAGCGGSGSGAAAGVASQSGSIFTVATDAPLPSVISCLITVNSVALSNGTTSTNVLSAPATVDFARLSGLHNLIDLSTVPTGTYSSATLTLASPVIGYIDTTVNPPAFHTINGTLSSSTVTVSLAQPFTLAANDLVGLRMEFDLHASLPTDGGGQVTGVVNPTFHMRLLAASNADVSIDDFRAGVVSVTDNNNFVVQGPHGRQWTVTTDSATNLDTNESAATLTTNAIVEVSGDINPVTHAIHATELAILSTDHFLVDGLLTSVRPPSGAATQADLYVRDELPDVSGVPLGQISTFTLNGSELYRIAHVALPLTTLVFNNSALAPGQEVAIGGSLTTVSGVTLLTPHRVVLAHQGKSGDWVSGSTIVTAGNTGSFQINANSLAGLLLPSPLTVMTTANTNFINLNGLSDLTGTQTIDLRVVGLILINPGTHQPVMVAGSVEKLPS